MELKHCGVYDPVVEPGFLRCILAGYSLKKNRPCIGMVSCLTYPASTLSAPIWLFFLLNNLVFPPSSSSQAACTLNRNVKRHETTQYVYFITSWAGARCTSSQYCKIGILMKQNSEGVIINHATFMILSFHLLYSTAGVSIVVPIASRPVSAPSKFPRQQIFPQRWPVSFHFSLLCFSPY